MQMFLNLQVDELCSCFLIFFQASSSTIWCTQINLVYSVVCHMSNSKHLSYPLICPPELPDGTSSLAAVKSD